MKRELIDRAAALQIMADAGQEYHGDGDFVRFLAYVIDVQTAAARIEALPVVEERPEIIHCRECKYGVDYYHDGDCYCSNPKWGLKYFGGSWDFYCADAEIGNSGKETAQED